MNFYLSRTKNRVEIKFNFTIIIDSKSDFTKLFSLTYYF